LTLPRQQNQKERKNPIQFKKTAPRVAKIGFA